MIHAVLDSLKKKKKNAHNASRKSPLLLQHYTFPSLPPPPRAACIALAENMQVNLNRIYDNSLLKKCARLH